MAAPPARFVVATRCPSCGAPLEFAEGSMVIACGYCSSRLLVTGRGRTLAYVVRPRVDGRQAAALAAAGSPGCRGEPRLHFVPYYRLVAGELRWEVHEPEPTPGHAPGDLTEQARSVVGRFAIAWATSRPEPRDARLPELRFADRRIEKSFLAAALPDLGVYSLGVRPGALALGLFERDAVVALGGIVPVDVGVEEAMRRALMAPADHRLVHREVVERVLSLVYFPYWLVPAEGGGAAVVDAVSSQVVVAAAAPELLVRLARAPEPPPPAAGFRSLACPNCGWDLPLGADEVIAHCRPCGRAWQIVADRLDAVQFEVARPGTAVVARDLVHLPVWILDAGAARCFGPAFRYRRLKGVHDLAVRLFRRQPRWGRWEGEAPPLRGCALDADDGRRLARFAVRGVELEARIQRRGAVAGVAATDAGEPPGETAARLVWLPFVPEPYALREPESGATLPRAPLG